LADSALAFAANSLGRQSLSIETSISHIVKVRENENLYATAEPIVTSDKFSHYQVKVKNSDSEIVATFKGTVYNLSLVWA
jgi:acyl-CoA thioesterase